MFLENIVAKWMCSAVEDVEKFNDVQITCIVTLRSVNATIIALEYQDVLHIPIVCF